MLRKELILNTNLSVIDVGRKQRKPARLKRSRQRSSFVKRGKGRSIEPNMKDGRLVKKPKRRKNGENVKKKKDLASCRQPPMVR